MHFLDYFEFATLWYVQNVKPVRFFKGFTFCTFPAIVRPNKSYHMHSKKFIFWIIVKPVLNSHSKIDKTKVLMENGSFDLH